MASAISLLFMLTAVGAQVSGGTDVNTSKLAGEQSECAVAKNPTNKLQLFVLCNNNAGVGLFAARSIDGGVTWTYPDPADKTIADGGNVATQGPAACCDPTLSWDTFGNLFVSYLDPNGTTVVVLLSTDGGQTFSNITPATFGPFCAFCVDQPTIVTGNTTAIGAPVAVWVVWHQNPSAGPMVAGGAAVTGLGAVGAFSAPQNIPGTADCSYGDVAIAPSGAVVQTCETPSQGNAPASQILVNTKPDGLGPNPFNAAVVVDTTNVAAFHPIPAQSNRTIDAEPGLAYDRNNDPMTPSPHFGRLYIVYNTEVGAFGSGDTDVVLRFSDNDGGTWSAPIRVNDDATTRSQFMPKIASNPLSGNIAVCWYDARNSAANTAMEVVCTMATPSGASPTFMPNAVISDASTTASFNGGNEFGDYSGLAYFQGLLHPAWPDRSNSTGDNPNTTTNFDIYTDRVSGGVASNEGDPHLITVNGVRYDFQGAGEFVSLRDYDGFQIQTRQSPVATTFNPPTDAHDGLSTCVSLNTAVAARVGKHRVTYEPNLSGVPDPSGLQLRVDGVLTTLGGNGIDLGDGGRIVSVPAPHGGGIEVDFPNGTVMYVIPNFWPDQGYWYMNVDVTRTPAVEGILGVIRAGDWLPALPNGTSMGPLPSGLHQRYLDLYQTFANAWRVTDATSLFDYASGTSTATFTFPTWPLENPPCTLAGLKPATPAEPHVAEQACKGIIDKNRRANCVFDVTVTGETGFADTYLATQKLVPSTTATGNGGTGTTGTGGTGTGGTFGNISPGKLALFLDFGAGIPHGTFSNFFNPGFSFNAGLEYMVNPHFSAEGIFGYHHFGSKLPAVSNLNVYQFSVNAKAYFVALPNKFRPFVNGGVGAYKFSPGSSHFGGNVGAGVLYEVTPKFGLQGSYNYHAVNTPGTTTKFSTIQGGVRFVF